jgi:hypothetical protein
VFNRRSVGTWISLKWDGDIGSLSNVLVVF